MADVTSTTPLFIQEVSALFDVTEVLALISLHGTTIGENIFKEFEKLIVQPKVESAMVVKVCGAKKDII